MAEWKTIMTAEGANSTGYGPRHRLYFDGDEAKFELWEAKFLAFLRTKKLHEVVLTEKEGGKQNADVDASLNADAYSEIVQVLDDTSLSLVMREAPYNGRKALQILREHYKSSSKPKIIALYTELTTMCKSEAETCTDFTIRAETAAALLKNAGETISDGLLTAMVLKGLPQDYLPFVTVATQKEEDANFSKFKTALKSFEETQKAGKNESSVMTFRGSGTGRPAAGGFSGKCFLCGVTGHRANQCSARGTGSNSGNRS